MGAREQFKQTGHVFAVEIEKIIPDPNQPRQSGGFDEDSIAILANDIALRGQDTPIEGRLLPDGTFMLNSGERRLRACRYINDHEHYNTKITHLNAILEPKPDRKQLDDKGRFLRQVNQNFHRESLCAKDEGLAYKKMVGEFGMTIKQISVEVGCSEQHVRDMLKYLEAPERFKEAVRARKMKPTAVVKAARATEEAQREVEEKLERGEKVREKDVEAVVSGKATVMTEDQIRKQIKKADAYFCREKTEKGQMRYRGMIEMARIILGEADPL